VSIVLAVAPPDGWERWSEPEQVRFFTRAAFVRRSLGTSSDYDLFRLTVLFQLEGGGLRHRFPAFDELNFGERFLPSAAVAPLLHELQVIESETATLPLESVVSPRAYSARLDLSLPPDEFRRRAEAERRRLLAGGIPLSTLDAGEIDLQQRLFRASYKVKKLRDAGDLFATTFRVYRFVSRRARERGRGVILS
jgi:hypothetical protein